MRSHPFGIVIAGGGTTGHLSPGIAIAEAFRKRNPENRVLFVGTGRPLEISVVSKAGFRHRVVTAEGLKSRGIWRQAHALMKVPVGIVESLRILRAFKADLVVGVGSYAAGPIVLGAWLLGIKSVLHEQNILPGMTNRLLAPFADRIYVSFKETGTYLKRSHVMITGNPVRSDIIAAAEAGVVTGGDEDRQKRPFTVLITGGSQGAHRLNMIMVEALAHLPPEGSFFFVHQTGVDDEDRVARAYQRCGVDSRVQSYFDDMANQYLRADLVICRAGATTIAEVTTIGKGALFVPLPSAADHHQELNARVLKDRGAADMILEEELNGEVLMGKIRFYASNRDALDAMAVKAKAFGRSDAATDIVDDCYRLLHPVNG